MGVTPPASTTSAPRQRPDAACCPLCGGELVVDGWFYVDVEGNEQELRYCPVCTARPRVGPDVVPAVDVRAGDVIDTAAGARLVDRVGRDPGTGLVHLRLVGAGAPVLSVGAGAEVTVLYRRDPFRSWSS